MCEQLRDKRTYAAYRKEDGGNKELKLMVSRVGEVSVGNLQIMMEWKELEF